MTGNVTLSKEEIFDFAKLSDSLIMSNALTLQMIENRIAKNPNISKVNASRESSSIKVEIVEKSPVAVVSNGRSLFLADDQLNLYTFKKENKNLDLPVISGLSGILDINTVPANEMRNLKIAQYIIKQAAKIDRVLYNYISEINFSDTSGIVLYSSEDATPIYLIDYNYVDTKGKMINVSRESEITNTPLRDAIKEKLIYLDEFLKQVLVYRVKYSFEYLDLRYNDIIVAKNNNISSNE
jgi:cell division septal protein FtsQ